MGTPPGGFRIEDGSDDSELVEAARQEAAKGHGTVLLAEDDPSVRSVTKRFLEASGYEVLEARSGPEALAISRSHAGPVDVLITDVLMPGLDGPELARELRGQRPGLGVLYLSGYSETMARAQKPSVSGSRFLQKPFTKQALNAELRRVLESRTA